MNERLKACRDETLAAIGGAPAALQILALVEEMEINTNEATDRVATACIGAVALLTPRQLAATGYLATQCTIVLQITAINCAPTTLNMLLMDEVTRTIVFAILGGVKQPRSDALSLARDAHSETPCSKFEDLSKAWSEAKRTYEAVEVHLTKEQEIQLEDYYELIDEQGGPC